MVAWIEVGGAGIAIEHLRRHATVRGVLTGFEQKYLARTPGRQAVGEHRSGRTAADDDKVVDHVSPCRSRATNAHCRRCRANPMWWALGRAQRARPRDPDVAMALSRRRRATACCSEVAQHSKGCS